MKIINPATDEVIGELEEDTHESLNQKVEKLRKGSSAWMSLPLVERVETLKRYSQLLKDETESLSRILTNEVGKPLQQSRNEINGARARIQWMTDNAQRYLSDEVMTEALGMVEQISYEPLGIICNISAWNYPYLVGTNVIVPALLAGNAVLYKPSEYASLTGLEVARLLQKAGVPEDAFQVAIGGPAVGEALLDLPLDGFFFTGSYRTGKHVYERVSARMIPCQCELGGKDPLYVADDNGDIHSVAVATADGAFYNSGQSCCAVERIYVHEKVYDQYVEEFVREVKSYRLGSPLEEGTYIGPLTRKAQVEFLEEQVAEAVKYGATLRAGGNKVEGAGNYFEPTVLTEVTHQMSVMRDESFGPIIGIMKVADDEEAIRLMQDTDYGLTASVYCSDRERAERILRQINAGTGYWNCCDRVSAAVPWSGRKHSGIGMTLSHAGLRAFTRPKAFHLKQS